MASEIQRQAFHILWIILVVMTYFIPRRPLLFLLFVGFIVTASLCFFMPLPREMWFVKDMMDYLHNLARDEELKVKMYIGSATFLLGALLSLWIFGIEIFRVAILVLSVGDAFTTLIGKHYGSHKLFYNKTKTWEGLVAGIISSFLVCLLLVPPHIAITVSVIGMLVESAPVELDDNLTIPLAVSLAMVIFL